MLKEPQKASIVKMASRANKRFRVPSISELKQSVDFPDKRSYFQNVPWNRKEQPRDLKLEIARPNARDNSPHVNTSYLSTLVVGLALLVELALPHVTSPLKL